MDHRSQSSTSSQGRGADRTPKPTKREQRRNISHACEHCRQRKVKCDGKRPFCGHCINYKLECYYGGTKKELTEKYPIHLPLPLLWPQYREYIAQRLKDLEIRVATYAALLRKLQPFADNNGQLAIQSALASNSDPAISQPITRSAEFYSPRQSISDTDSERSVDVPAASLDRTVEDINTFFINDPTGFMGMGKVSSVSLLYCVKKELASSQQSDPSSENEIVMEAEGKDTICHLDDVGDFQPERQIDPFYCPSRDIADKFILAYLKTIHPLFPILREQGLLETYERVYVSGEPGDLGNWLATLNLVFAIERTYFHLMGDEEIGEDVDHTVYFMRARVLGALDGTSMFSTAGLQQVRTLGLTGMYLLASHQINRSWNVIGLAIRMAYGIGLHLRNDAPGLDNEQKEQRLRVWHSLYYLESILCIITGRPSAIQDRACNASVPNRLTVRDGVEKSDPTSPDPYMVACTSLSAIAAEMLGRLYSPHGSFEESKNWSDIQRNIELLTSYLERWKRDLPEFLDFEKSQTDQTSIYQRIDIALRYHHIMMLMNRPCLRQIETRTPGSHPNLKDFAQKAAVACIRSAHKVINLIVHTLGTDPFNPIRTGPWWCLLYYAVSAGAIMMLELAFQATHAPEQCDAMFEDASSLIAWLNAISSAGNNEGARRCYVDLMKLLTNIAPKVGCHFDGTFEDASNKWAPPTAAPGFQQQQQQHRQHQYQYPSEDPRKEKPQQYFPATKFLHEPGSSGYKPRFNES